MSAPRGRASLRILAETVPSVTTSPGQGTRKGERLCDSHALLGLDERGACFCSRENRQRAARFAVAGRFGPVLVRVPNQGRTPTPPTTSDPPGERA